MLIKFKTILTRDRIPQAVADSLVNLKDRIQDDKMRGSGWSFKLIHNLVFHVNKYQPLRGATYKKTPKFITIKKACVNVKNKIGRRRPVQYDNECFRWSILAALHPVDKHVDRVSKYTEYRDELDFTDIDFPVQVQTNVYK